MRKRLCATILATVIIILNSCASSTNLLLPFIPIDDENELDFGGYEFKILSGDASSYDPTLKDTSGSALSVWDDALISWNDYIEKTYNCQISSEDYLIMYLASSAFTPQIASGTADWSLIAVNGVDLMALYKGKYLTPWSDTDLDLTNHEKYGTENYMSSSTFNGKTYGITTRNWSPCDGFIGMIISNNALLRNYVDVNVHELKENKQWTFDNFKKLLEACTVNIGSSMDILPMTCFSDRILAKISVFANGGQIVEYNETTGKYSYGLTSPKALRGIEYAKSLYDAKLCRQAAENGKNFWENGDAVFLLAGMGLDQSMRVFEDLDIISFPYGPDVEYGSVCSAYMNRDTGYLTCPITAEADLVTKFVSIWFEQFPDLSKAQLIEDFKNTYFYNENSINEYFYMAENYQNTYYTHFGDVAETMITTLNSLTTETGTISEKLEKTRAIFEAQINKAFNE